MSIRRRWKGKERVVEFELDVRDEGAGGEDGIVLPLELVGTGVYDVAYTVPVKILSNNQQFSLQVDTGSSDLWIASTSCSTSSCLQTKGHLYNPSGSVPTGVNFTISYLSGSASGPIVWDQLSIGGYVVDHQALAAVTDVENEPLAPDFNGILGLALPLNSIIAKNISPVKNNNPDGAAWASNLFSLSPTNAAPSSRFLSLALSRPGSNQMPAAFGIERHPSSVVSNPGLIQYSTSVSDSIGTLFWKATVRAITVYINGTTRQIQVGKSHSGAIFPSAVLDSGVPLILTTTAIANGIYGALGINPAQDGMYYVPCTTPLNMTITLDDRPEIPLHPLDLTAKPPQDNQSQSCVGLIQTADAQLSNPQTSKGDIILGVPFMRNVYTVMAYTIPNSDGSFPPTDGSNQTGGKVRPTIQPQLGLMSLTSPTQALQEFNTVRVLNQSISSVGNGTTGGGFGTGRNGNGMVMLGGKRLSVGIVVLIGIISFFVLCCLLFFIRWFIYRRKYDDGGSEKNRAGGAFKMDKVAYMLTRSAPHKDENTLVGGGGGGGGDLTEDELREKRYERHMQRRSLSTRTTSSDGTHIDHESLGYGYGHGYGYGYGKDNDDDKFGIKKTKVIFERSRQDEDEMWGLKNGTRPDSWNRTQHGRQGSDVPLVADQERQQSTSPPSSPKPLPTMLQNEAAASHRRNPSLAVPLLPHQETAIGEYDPLTPFNSFQPNRRTP